MMDFEAYSRQLYDALRTVDPAALNAATALLETAYDQDKAVYAAGNGQSASTADAFALDLYKQTVGRYDIRRFRAISLASNVAALTAWANDRDYEAIFTEQLRTYLQAGDVFVAFSASGNSPNMVQAAEWVRANGGYTVALTGFSGGCLREVAHACVHVAVSDYGHAETAHVAIMHYWVDYFKEKLAQLAQTSD